uniref:2Fe-2S ferredoxin-type domain-containing protein n=1 Tax=Lotharella globosa TaxID=91324 RepID=A0A7S3ZF78_9EUKA|mmetsp:Transcript_37696/g.72560  ORF Transcript_37696/g.72560 Transcript_37696/m.72560 type:complete len:168 (-) Transcript_37696:172-675(-)
MASTHAYFRKASGFLLKQPLALQRVPRMSRMGSTMPASVTLHVVTPEDSEVSVSAVPGEFIMQALERADLSDFWDGGACGGSCSCSTCRVILTDELYAAVPEPEENEIDMLESAAAQEESPEEQDAFLKKARLACQVEVTAEMDGARLVLPEDTRNMLEVPLWMRER